VKRLLDEGRARYLEQLGFEVELVHYCRCREPLERAVRELVHYCR
jgi:hypothetical protein